MPRGFRLDAPGTLRHALVRGIELKRIVMDDKDRKDLMDRMGDLAVITGATIYSLALLFHAPVYPHPHTSFKNNY